MPTDIKKTKLLLEKLYKKYNRKENIPPDPLQFVYKYQKAHDMEIAALLSAMLAYGRVSQIEKSLTNLFARMGKSPFEFVVNFDKAKRLSLTDFKHRFNTGNDISDLFISLKKVLNKYGSLEKYFLTGYSSKDRNIIPALTAFCHKLMNDYASQHQRRISPGLKYLLTDPAKASACKRLNLFLRWMVRDDNIDTGLWKSIDKAKLIIPMDVHMSRISAMLNFHHQKTITLKTAVKVTGRFAQIQPTDPVRYDFTLCRIGMLANIADLDRLK
jgi:uncharacterized protein (TIGR02757 family)